MNQFRTFTKIIRGEQLSILDNNQRFAQTALRPTAIQGHAVVRSADNSSRTGQPAKTGFSGKSPAEAGNAEVQPQMFRVALEKLIRPSQLQGSLVQGRKTH